MFNMRLIAAIIAASAAWIGLTSVVPARLHARTRTASETIIHAFKATKQGASPFGPLIRVGGRFYGTTYEGGKYGAGTIFSVTKTGGFRVEHDFTSGNDGGYPVGSLLAMGGTLYGTTSGGGGTNNSGTVFSLVPGGAYTQLVEFQGGSDGAGPGDLAAIDGTLFGTTFAGGTSANNCNCGIVYSLTPSGAKQIIYNFQGGADGASPTGLIASGTALYGMTANGGTTGCSGTGCGTVYGITPDGVKTVLHMFDKQKDGILPRGKPLLVDGVLYGSTTFGGTSTACGNDGCGTVFRLTLAGAYRSLHSFALTDGSGPQAGLIDSKGLLYGTTFGGGPSNRGVVFAISRQGNLTDLHDFKGGSDGIAPMGDLLEDGGVFYGTTAYGGASAKRACPRLGCGTIFAVQP